MAKEKVETNLYRTKGGGGVVTETNIFIKDKIMFGHFYVRFSAIK